jgi:hypothetical protein
MTKHSPYKLLAMSATVTKIVKFTLPKLKSDGSNRILFQDSIELETSSHNFQSHLNGTGVILVHPHPSVAAPTVDQKKEIDDYLVALKKWTAGEATIKKGFMEALPLTLYLVVCKETTMREVWDSVFKHHQQKAQLIIVELRRKLQNEKCEEKGDIRAHLAKLRQMHEDLAMMGEVVTDNNFCSIILGSLPGSFDMFLTSITNQISPIPYKITVAPKTVGMVTYPQCEIVVSTPKISPDDLIKTLGQEADWRGIRAGQTKKDDSDAAFTACLQSGSRRSRNGEKPKGKCYNCGKPKHFLQDCWAEGGGKAGQGPRGRSQTKKNENATTATENAAWMARELDNGGDDNDDPFEGLPDDDDMPPLQDVSDSESESDSDDDDMPPLQAGYDSDDESESDGEVLELYEDDEDEPSAMLANDKKNTGMNMDRYDSGATSIRKPAER